MADLNLTRDPWLATRIANHMGDKPKLWSFDNHRVNLGYLKIWVANGRGYLRIDDPVRIEFAWYDRRILWRAIKALHALNREDARRVAIVNGLLRDATIAKMRKTA